LKGPKRGSHHKSAPHMLKFHTSQFWI